MFFLSSVVTFLHSVSFSTHKCDPEFSVNEIKSLSEINHGILIVEDFLHTKQCKNMHCLSTSY